MTTKVVPELLDQSNGIGYTIGVGGAQTQQTSKSTTVTINAPCGQITMHNESLAAGATVAFNVSNTFVDASDVVVIHPSWGANTSYRAQCVFCDNNIFAVTVQNVSGAPLAEAVVLNFAVIKGVTS